jgi:predicted RecB family nuclease
VQKIDGRWVLSAGDLVDVVECGHRVGLTHAVADGLASSDGGNPGPDGAGPDEPVRQVGRTAPDRTAVRHGEAHERRWLRHLRECFGTAGVVEIGRPAPTRAGLAAAAQRTREALAAGVPVIYQGVLFDGGFQGRPDFLIATHLDPRTGAARGPARASHYEPYDAKLARHARPGAVLQLAAYALALPAAGVTPPEHMHLLHPARDARAEVGVVRTFRVEDVGPLVDHARGRLERRLAEQPTLPEPDWGEPRPECAGCGYAEHCARGRARSRDLSLVAGLRADQRRVLRAGGIATVEQLAVATDDQRPPAMSATSFAGLRLQAELQAAQDRTRSTDDPLGTVSVRMVDPRGLMMLPAPDPADIYFDMEGDPYALDAAGLEYLFGAITVAEPPNGQVATAGEDPGPAERFHAFWAHDRAGEREAFEAFVDWAVGRLRDRPGAHIYHYAPYEPAALRRLAARHGTRERQVDDLLARGRLVDLYAVVRGSLRVSQPSYSIKYLEPLFYPGARTAQVTNAADSIVAYESFLELRAAGETAEAHRILGEIAEYNRVDCVSTHRLHRWLLELHQREGLATRDPALAAGAPNAADPDGSADQGALAPDDDPDALVDTLVAGLPADPAAWSADERARALLAAAVGYHRRENKPAWWSYFAALTADRESLETADDCAVPLRWDVVEDWEEPTGRRRRSRRLLRATTAPERQHPFERNESVRLLYPPHRSSGPQQPSAEGVTTDAVVERAAPHELLLRESGPPDQAGRDLPAAVLPGAPVRPEPKPAAIRQLAGRTAAALPALPAEAGIDLLRRLPPRLVGSGALPSAAAHGDDLVDAVLAAVSSLDNSYLAVQGPPGAGKTYLAGRLIQHLVGLGWSVGICSTSHKAIENAMLAATGQRPASTEASWRPRVPAAKKRRAAAADPASPPPWDTPRDLRALVAWREEHPDGHLVGDTAWAFANPALTATPFDVLIIDEAGQFALADTLAVAPAARNLVLLGDPQQLPQVVAGLHPEGADASALSHLLGAAEVIPPEFGYFLDRTRRLHPAVCAPVSALAYRGRLQAHPVAATRSVDGVPAGLYLLDVVHHDNATRSDEEVAAVCAAARHVLGRTSLDGTRARPVTGADVLVVAPYNRQVRAIEHALDRAGLTGVRVGTVDRFQGQEASVVIVSLTTSSAAEAPRGLDFLLSRNRLNVALSRAQVAAVLVMSPALIDSSPRSVAELALLAGLARLRATARTDLLVSPSPSPSDGPAAVSPARL